MFFSFLGLMEVLWTESLPSSPKQPAKTNKIKNKQNKKNEPIEPQETTIDFITSFKGSVQICANGFPFTRHRVLGSTVYWRCVQNKSLG